MADDWIKLQGRLVYDPARSFTRVDGQVVNLRKQYKARTLIVDLPRDGLWRFYQWILKTKYGTWLELESPMWGTHITVVRGDEEAWKHPRWLAHKDELVELEYSPILQYHFGFWSLPVRGKRLEALRLELDLTRHHNFHITIGRQHVWQKQTNWFQTGDAP